MFENLASDELRVVPLWGGCAGIRVSTQHLKARPAGELPAVLVDVAVIVQDVDELQVVPLARGEIVGVVGRRDFDRACPERHVYQLRIEDDGQPPPVHGVHHVLTMQVRIPAQTELTVLAGSVRVDQSG